MKLKLIAYLMFAIIVVLLATSNHKISIKKEWNHTVPKHLYALNYIKLLPLIGKTN